MPKRIIALLVFLSISAAVWAQRIYTRQEYIKQHARAAVEEMYRSGVPASITLAQGCLESGNGNSELSVKSNNHFGIKCHGWSGKGMRYNDDAPNECFRVYASVADSYADHSDFLTNNSRYAFLFEFDINNYKGWARGLKKAGYATDPRYADKLIKIIEENNLQQYDKMNPKELQKSNLPKENDTAAIQPNTNKEWAVSPPKKTTRVVEVNSCKAVYVQEGDSPQKIADKYGVKLWEIYNYNDFADNHRIEVGEIIYLQKKKKKADRRHRYHTVKAGESFHFISQKYGVRLESLYKINRLDAQSAIKVGQRLSLRKRVK